MVAGSGIVAGRIRSCHGRFVIDCDRGKPWREHYYYLVRHLIYVILGLMLASTFRVIPIAFLERISRPLMWLSALVLLLVFIPRYRAQRQR